MKLVIKLAMLLSMLIAAATTSTSFAQTNCAECDGKVNLLVMRYDKSDGGYVEAYSKKGVLLFAGYRGTTLVPNRTFVLSGNDNWLDRKSTVGPGVNLFVNGVYHANIHTSCSVPIGPGTKAGDFVVLFAFSRNTDATPLCATGDIPAPGGID